VGRNGGLQCQHDANLATRMHTFDVREAEDRDDQVLMRPVAEPHPHVEERVFPFPRGVATDHVGAIHQTIEHHVDAGGRQTTEPGELASLTPIGQALAGIGRSHRRVIVS
jgi:hypothetical protein